MEPSTKSSAETSTPSGHGSAGSARPGHLLRVLGVTFGIAVTVGNTIGAGILRTPGVIAANLPHPGMYLLVWFLGGLFALLCACSLAELGAMIPRSGGHYVFARHAFGEYAGFIIGWCDWLGNAGSSAAVAIVIGEYSGRLFPPLASYATAIACSVVVFFALLQWRGVRWGSGTQNISSLLKTLGFLALVAACFWYGTGAGFKVEPAVWARAIHPAGTTLFAVFILALQSVIYTYDGWAGIVYFSEETLDPGRNVPRSMFGGTLSIIAIYLLLNLALLYVLPISQIAGDPLALGSASRVIFGPRGDTLLAVVTIISMLAAINAFQLMTCRILYSMSVDGLFTRRAARVNQGGTPDVALALSTMVAVLFILSGTLESVIALLAFFFVTDYVVDLLAVFVLRFREPERERPFRAFGYPFTTAIALIAYVAFLIGTTITDWEHSMWSLAILALSWPLFLVFRRGLKPAR